MEELTNIELSEINGGKSFAYRVGQAVAVAYDVSFGGRPYVIDTVGGMNAIADWFG